MLSYASLKRVVLCQCRPNLLTRCFVICILMVWIVICVYSIWFVSISICPLFWNEDLRSPSILTGAYGFRRIYCKYCDYTVLKLLRQSSEPARRWPCPGCCICLCLCPDTVFRVSDDNLLLNNPVELEVVTNATNKGNIVIRLHKLRHDELLGDV